MSAPKRFRVIIAQSVLTEISVTAPDRDTAENLALTQYVEPSGPFTATAWLSDACEIIDVTEHDCAEPGGTP